MDLVDAVDLKEGETVLIVGATGGVGSYAVQLAARRGARVIATARRESEAFVRELGAAEATDHEVLGRIAGLVNEGGRLASSVYAADVEGLAERGVEATNIGMQADAGRLEELSRMVDAGKLSVRLERTFPLEEAPEALEESRTRHVRGKIVLLVDREA